MDVLAWFVVLVALIIFNFLVLYTCSLTVTSFSCHLNNTDGWVKDFDMFHSNIQHIRALIALFLNTRLQNVGIAASLQMSGLFGLSLENTQCR